GIHHGNSVRHETTSASMVPGDWKPWTAPHQGFHISYPPGWILSETTRGGEYAQRYADPSGGGSFEVNAERLNPSASPVQHWRDSSKTLASQLPDYHQVALTQVLWNGNQAADLEYTFTSGGTTMREIDREVFIGNSSRAYVISAT